VNQHSAATASSTLQRRANEQTKRAGRDCDWETERAARLRHGLDNLGPASRDAPAHASATLESSYALLAPHEQTAFTALAVFPGGCTLEAPKTVTGRRSGARGALRRQPRGCAAAGRRTGPHHARDGPRARAGPGSPSGRTPATVTGATATNSRPPSDPCRGCGARIRPPHHERSQPDVEIGAESRKIVMRRFTAIGESL
jgi:hypothetical protein